MDYPVLRRFRDRITGVSYRPGSVFATDDAARGAELVKGKFVAAGVGDVVKFDRKAALARATELDLEFKGNISNADLEVLVAEAEIEAAKAPGAGEGSDEDTKSEQDPASEGSDED